MKSQYAFDIHCLKMLKDFVFYRAFLIIKQGNCFFVVFCRIYSIMLYLHCSEKFFINKYNMPLILCFHSASEMLSLEIIMY